MSKESVGEWQAFAAAQDQMRRCDRFPRKRRACSNWVGLKSTPTKGTSSRRAELPEQLAVSAADFEDRGGPISGQPFGEPFRA